MKELYENILSYSHYEFAGNSLPKYLIALLVLFGSAIILKIIARIITKQIRKLATKTKLEWDDVLVDLIGKNSPLFVWVVSLYISLKFITISASLHHLVDVLFAIILGIIFISIIQGLMAYWFKVKYFDVENINVAKKSVMKNMLLLLKVVLWMMVLLFILDNLGFDITTAVAGLGIGGMALALASQNILGDVFSYFTIFFDKPFEVGDFVIVGDLMGVVDHIGIKTTRIKSLQGEQLVFGNSDLIGSRIKNFKQMQSRRVCSSLGVTYETAEDKLKKVPDIIKNIIVNKEKANFDRAHFKSFGDFSLDFEYVYYVMSSDYNAFMDIQQSINYELFDTFAKEGIEFAYPTQMIHMNK